MNRLYHKIEILKNKIADHAPVEESEEVLSDIINLKDPSSIELLVALFDDAQEQEELMYGIIHAIENFDDQTYAKHILNTVPRFIYKAPRWASIVHMRILNSDETRVAYIKECHKNATKEQKEALKDLLMSINRVSPSFLVQTVPLLGVLE